MTRHFILALAGASPLASLAIAATTNTTCHEYVILSARGTTEPQGPSVGFTGMINTTLSKLPGGIEYDVVYPADAGLQANIGGDDIARFVTEGFAACPSQIYAVLGYSQGAVASALGLRKLTTTPSSAAAAAQIKAVLQIGNPGRVPDQPANVDNLGGASNRNYTGAVYLDGAAAVPLTFYEQAKVLDICEIGDWYCAPYSNSTPSMFFEHLRYGGDAKVQQMGADFLIRQLSRNLTASSSSTSSQNSTSTGATTSQTAGTTTTSVTPSATPSGSVAPVTGAAAITRASLFSALCSIALIALLLAEL